MSSNTYSKRHKPPSFRDSNCNVVAKGVGPGKIIWIYGPYHISFQCSPLWKTSRFFFTLYRLMFPKIYGLLLEEEKCPAIRTSHKRRRKECDEYRFACICICGEGTGNLLQYSWLGDPMNRVWAWWAIVHGVAKSQTWLRKWAHIYVSITSKLNSFYYHRHFITIYSKFLEVAIWSIWE